MPGRTYFVANTPAFAEFVYYKMKTASLEVRSKLTTQELRDFKDDTAIRKFANNETMERRLVMLTRLGMQFTVMVMAPDADIEWVKGAVSEEIPFPVKSKEVLQQLKSGEQFVFGSRELMMNLQLAEAYSHGQMYVLNADYLHMENIINGTERVIRRNQKMRDAAEVYMDMARLVTHVITAFDQVRCISGLNELQTRILLMIFAYRNTYVTLGTINSKIGLPTSHVGTVTPINVLEKRNLVKRMMRGNTDWGKNGFAVTEQGIEMAMQFLKYLKNKTLHEQQ